MHLNDSKGDLGDCKDRHESLGKGKIGINCFKFIMNDKRYFFGSNLFLFFFCGSFLFVQKTSNFSHNL